MRMKLPLLALSLTVFGARSAALGQSKDIPKVRAIGKPDASIPLGMRGSPVVRVTDAGRVFAADFFDRRLAMVDPDLTQVETVFDATTPSPLAYPSGFAMLVPAPGDTTLFYDAGARGFRVLDPSGKLVRRLSVADPSLQRPLQSPASNAVLTASGHLVFVTQRQNFEKTVPGIQPQAESLMVVRTAVNRTGWDSLTAIMGSGQSIVQTGDTSLKPRPTIMTMPAVDRGDAWTVLRDGTIAIVRSSDFHVDWILPDGSRRSSPSVPWPWKKYTKAERDSIRASVEAVYGSANIRSVSSTGATGPSVMPMSTRVVDTVPERMPAIASTTARVDLDGRIWIELGPRVMVGRIAAPVVYGVLDSNGQLVDRVELGERRLLAGFGPAGSVYVISPPGPANPREGYVIERYRYRKP